MSTIPNIGLQRWQWLEKIWANSLIFVIEKLNHPMAKGDCSFIKIP